MSTPYIGEIRMFAGNFAPQGWALCQGQILAISENDTLFSLIGTTYGGDGISTFALPDLRSRVPIHQGNGLVLAQVGGEELVTLTVNQIPIHTHAPMANSDNGTATTPGGNVWAASADISQYAVGTTGAMSGSAVSPAGGSQPHDNMLPYLAINFIISLFGLFPSQN